MLRVLIGVVAFVLINKYIVNPFMSELYEEFLNTSDDLDELWKDEK